MKPMTVQAAQPYHIHFAENYEGLRDTFYEIFPSQTKLCMVSDSHVAPLYAREIGLAMGRDIPTFVFEAGEAQKHFGTLQDMYAFLLAHKMDRKSCVLALGGGVAGDMAGFAAATFMRGIPFVQLPTSLLAQVDASVGGKTAVDFGGVKNLVGAFHQPRMVYINLRTLRTLPAVEFASGMAEALKHGLIADPAYYQFLADEAAAIQALEPAALFRVVAGSCRVKAQVVAQDEKERGLREVLNFGHCVGHAVESLSGYTLPHGHCVALGMVAALEASCRLGAVSQGDVDTARQRLLAYGLPVTHHMDAQTVLQAMYTDKKVLDNALRVVLLSAVGQAYTHDALSPEMVLDTLAALYA